MKRCSSCKLHLNRAEFHKDANRHDGLDSRCRHCRRDPARNPQPPKQLAPLGAWRDRAVCVTADPEIFYPDKGGSVTEAKRVCAHCPVTAECLDYALTHDEWWGVWGGMSEQERRRLMGYPLKTSYRGRVSV